MVAPLLEQMNVTKAIPLATSTPQPAPARKQEQGMDMSCLSPWQQFKEELALANIRQCCYGNSDMVPIAKLVFLLHNKTKTGSYSFYAAKELVSFLRTHYASTAIACDVLTVLIPSLPALCSHVDQFQGHSQQVIEDAIALFVTLLQDDKSDVSLQCFAYIGLGAMCCEETKSRILGNKSILDMINTLRLAMDDEVMVRFAKCCFLGNCCKIVRVSGDGEDASDEAMLILSDFTTSLFEEDRKDILDIRICALYTLVKRGGALERISLQSSGVDEETALKIHDCDAKWKELVRLCCE